MAFNTELNTALNTLMQNFALSLRAGLEREVDKDGIRFQGKSNAIASGNLYNSIIHAVTSEGEKVTVGNVFALDYWRAVDGGEENPNVSETEIRNWIIDKRIEVDNLEAATTAITNSLNRDGTVKEPNKFYTNAIPEFERDLQTARNNILNALRAEVTVTIKKP